jgi:hypothetical protein
MPRCRRTAIGILDASSLIRAVALSYLSGGLRKRPTHEIHAATMQERSQYE